MQAGLVVSMLGRAVSGTSMKKVGSDQYQRHFHSFVLQMFIEHLPHARRQDKTRVNQTQVPGFRGMALSCGHLVAFYKINSGGLSVCVCECTRAHVYGTWADMLPTFTEILEHVQIVL